MIDRPKGVTAIGILFTIISFLGFSGASILFILQLELYIPIIIVVVSIIILIPGIGLLYLKNWARQMTIVFTWIGLIVCGYYCLLMLVASSIPSVQMINDVSAMVIYGLILIAFCTIDIIILYYLRSKKIRKSFFESF